MKRRTNLSQPRINKIVKFLEEKGMIKFVKSVQNASRKVGMLGTGCVVQLEGRKGHMAGTGREEQGGRQSRLTWGACRVWCLACTRSSCPCNRCSSCRRRDEAKIGVMAIITSRCVQSLPILPLADVHAV